MNLSDDHGIVLDEYIREGDQQVMVRVPGAYLRIYISRKCLASLGPMIVREANRERSN